MKFKLFIFLITFIGITINVYSQIDLLDLKEGVDYDARFFLTNTQINTFNSRYPDFDSIKVEKIWEWKDVDPLELFTPEENRAKRREIFLFELNPYVVGEKKTTIDQVAYKIRVETQVENSEIFIDNSTMKIILPYTIYYEGLKLKQIHNLLEKISVLGLEWALTGADNLYIYNGNILLGRYLSGYVSLAKLQLDSPNKVYRKSKKINNVNIRNNKKI